jgi:hypothetical protein
VDSSAGRSGEIERVTLGKGGGSGEGKKDLDWEVDKIKEYIIDGGIQ